MHYNLPNGERYPIRRPPPVVITPSKTTPIEALGVATPSEPRMAEESRTLHAVSRPDDKGAEAGNE
jgi:hypothetical protein